MVYAKDTLEELSIASASPKKRDHEQQMHCMIQHTEDTVDGSDTKDQDKIKTDLEEDEDPKSRFIKETEPDGGYGWLVVLGAFCAQIATSGVMSSWGVMQDYYHRTWFSDDPNALFNLSFIGTSALVINCAASPLIHICVARYGLGSVIITGTILIFLALETASFASKLWHLYLTQGILFGLGASCMYVTVLAVTPQWFTKHRGTALGIVASASGVGGLIIPFIVTPVNRSLGSAWTCRILGFICLVCDIVACIFVKERIPRPREKKKLSQMVQLNVFKNTNFLLFCIGSNIMGAGYFVPIFFIPAYATYLGLSDSQGSVLISVCSTMICIGRVVSGFLGDRIGALNCSILFHGMTAMSCLFIWTFAVSFDSLMAFSVVYGFTCGSHATLMSPISASILGMDRLASGLSLLIFFGSFPVFGVNIACAIEAGVNSPPFFSYKMFAGVAFLSGVLILFVLKLKLNRNPFTKL